MVRSKASVESSSLWKCYRAIRSRFHYLVRLDQVTSLGLDAVVLRFQDARYCTIQQVRVFFLYLVYASSGASDLPLAGLARAPFPYGCHLHMARIQHKIC